MCFLDALAEGLFPDFCAQWGPKVMIWRVVFDTFPGLVAHVEIVFLLVFFYVFEGWRGQESKKF